MVKAQGRNKTSCCPAVPGYEEVFWLLIDLDSYGISWMKRPVREINDDLLVGIPLVLLAPNPSDRLDSKMVRRDKIVAVECLDSTGEPVSVPVEICSQVFVGIGLRSVVEKNDPRIVIESPLFVRMDNGPNLDERGCLDHFLKVKLEAWKQQEHEHGKDYGDRHQENGGNSIGVPAIISPNDQDVKNALTVHLIIPVLIKGFLIQGVINRGNYFWRRKRGFINKSLHPF